MWILNFMLINIKINTFILTYIIQIYIYIYIYLCIKFTTTKYIFNDKKIRH